MSYPSYHHGGRYPADEHPPPWAMGAGYHPDGGDCYHYGEPGEFHVGAGLSQKVHGPGRTVGWAVKTKKGEKIIYPYNQRRHEAGKRKNIKFRNYTGTFKDTNGNTFIVPKFQPEIMETPKEYAKRFRNPAPDFGPQHPNRRSGKKQQKTQKKKRRTNEKVDSYLIRVLEKIKSEVDKSKKDAKTFPNLGNLTDPSIQDFKTAFSAFKESFTNSLNDFAGRNPGKTWPTDLENWNFPAPLDDVEAAYREFYRHVSRLKRGIAQLIISNRNYKSAKHESNILAKAIAKANGIDEEITMEQLKSIFSEKYEIALHSEKHIFAMLPTRLDGIVTQEYTFETLAAKLTEKKIVDIKTMGILSNNNYKILKQVLKRAKKHEKKVSQPRAPTAQPNESQFRIGSHGLVGMSSAHVY